MTVYTCTIVDDQTSSKFLVEIDTLIDGLTINSTSILGNFKNGFVIAVDASKQLNLISEDNSIKIDSVLNASFSFALRDRQVADNTKDVVLEVESSNSNAVKAILDALQESYSYLDFDVTCEVV